MTVSSRLISINASKIAIKEAIEAKGVTVGSAPLSEYADKIAEITTTPTGFEAPEEWPDINIPFGTEKIIGLVAVWPSPHPNVCTIAVTTADSSTYDVDWGDGTLANVASSSTVPAEHTFNYSDISLIDTPYGYKIAVVEVTPTAGSFTGIYFTVKHSSESSAINRKSEWLDISIRATSVSTLSLSNTVNTTYSASKLKRFRYLGANSIVTPGTLFNACTSLVEVMELDTSLCTTIGQLFLDCYSLKFVPTLNLSVCTNALGLFLNCRSIESVPAINYSSVTNPSQMFSGCTSLKTVPDMVINSATTTLQNMFLNCSSLVTAPNITNTASVVTWSSFFSGCTLLETFPAYNTSAGTTFSTMLTGCISLKEIPAISFALMSSNQWVASLGSVQRIQCSFANNRTISINFYRLAQAQLVEVFNNLPTASGAQSINITGNPGATPLTAPERAIATGKGWTITG